MIWYCSVQYYYYLIDFQFQVNFRKELTNENAENDPNSEYNKSGQDPAFQYTNFALVKKTKEVGLYQIGCVNRSGFRSCTHSDETFLFFVHNGKVILYPNNLDQSEPIAYLKTMQEEEAISENDKEMFSKKIESITLLNTNQQKNKPKERW